jgi:predicted transcriptional regulator
MSAVEKHQVKHKDKHQVKITDTAFAVLKALDGRTLSRKEIFAAIGLIGDSRSFKRNIEPLMAEGFIEMTVQDKPNSKLQEYRLTGKGLELIRQKLSAESDMR